MDRRCLFRMRVFRKRLFRNGYFEFNFESLISKKFHGYFEFNFENLSFKTAVRNLIISVFYGDRI
jgi:hypothetical protein